MAETIIAGTAVAMDAGPVRRKIRGIMAVHYRGRLCSRGEDGHSGRTWVGDRIRFVSPWPDRGASVTTFAVTTAIWLIVTQWVSSGLGGYIAGRLRTRWIGTHPHEVFFRDTAHGLITWAVATILVVAVGASTFRSAAGAAGRAANAGATAAMIAGAGSAGGAMSANRQRRMPIRRFRHTRSTSSIEHRISAGHRLLADARIETAHIAANVFATGSISSADRAYLVEQVAARTGASQADAQARVDNFVAALTQAQEKLKAEADSARKAAAEAAIYLALSMLIGAFIASVAAALGGRIETSTSNTYVKE